MAEVKSAVAGSDDGVSGNEVDAGEMSFDAMIERMKEASRDVEDQEPTGHQRSDRGRAPVTDDGSPEGKTINDHHDKDPPKCRNLRMRVEMYVVSHFLDLSAI